VIFPYTVAFPNTPPRPYLDVILRNGGYTTNKLVALVDSGADYPIFPDEAAQQLRLNLISAPVWKFSGTSGKIQIAKLAEVSLTVLEDDDIGHAFEMKVTCAFCDSLNFPGGALLGQNGFFSQFKTTFFQPRNYFEIEPL
jgi:hypothetical protein